jgi:RIO-like serine/threonine protein kinase fused to N-terminal HTH domain
VAQDVLETLNVALSLGIVHGDLSPYNIIAGEKTYVIDWPQWIPVGHPAAEEFLRRDLHNVATYFAERGVAIPVEDLLKAAREGGDSGRRFIEYIKTSLL